MNLVKFYQPEYYKNFRCTGSECRNNCCHHWSIDIDKATYDKYMAFNEDIKQEFIDKLTPQKNPDAGALAKVDSEGNCMFLNSKGLCTIQLRFGHDYLSKTCKIYPRIFNLIDNSPERFLELSCEAAAKDILLDKNFMNFYEVEEDLNTHESGGINIHSTLKPEKYTKTENSINIFWKLRVTTIAILQSRKYTVRFRMMILCIFMQDVSDYLSSGRDNTVINLSEVYLNRIESNYYKDLFASMPNGVDREFGVMLDILKEMYLRRNALFMKSVNFALGGFDIDPDKWILPDDMNEMFTRIYEMYFADKEYIFENYLVHRVLSEGFPFNYKGEGNVLNNYVDLMTKYNIVEFLFTGICRSCMKYDKRHIIDCISAFTRAYDHSFTKFLKTEEFFSNI